MEEKDITFEVPEGVTEMSDLEPNISPGDGAWWNYFTGDHETENKKSSTKQ